MGSVFAGATFMALKHQGLIFGVLQGIGEVLFFRYLRNSQPRRWSRTLCAPNPEAGL